MNKKMRSAPLPDKPSGRGLFGLRERNRGRTNDGSACRPLFMHSPRPEPRGLYGLATRYVMGTTWFSIERYHRARRLRTPGGRNPSQAIDSKMKNKFWSPVMASGVTLQPRRSVLPLGWGKDSLT